MSRSGILAAGNFIVDKVKTIDIYPAQDCLANIQSVDTCNGGGPFNLLVDLAHMECGFPLAAAGLVSGLDDEGRYVRRFLEDRSVDTSMLGTTDEALTSYTDVMSVADTGRRTFFHYRGANALLGPEHLSLEGSNAKMFYLGYLLLLDGLDKVEGDQTGAAFVLKRARELGMVTAVDCVSEDSHRFRDVVLPALHHADIVFMNEIEAERTTGVPVRDPSSCDLVARELLRQGVEKAVFLHMPYGAYAKATTGETAWQSSVNLPADRIAGAVGAGDAFAAGVLSGWHEGLDLATCLKQGVCVAASCLTHPTTSGGVKPLAECLALGDQYGFITV